MSRWHEVGGKKVMVQESEMFFFFKRKTAYEIGL